MNIAVVRRDSGTRFKASAGTARVAGLIAFLLALGSAFAALCAAQSKPQVDISILSSRPDMVTGGDALVQIVGVRDIHKISVWANGREVTAAFHTIAQTQTLTGLAEGLAVGKNEIQVKSAGRVVAHLEVVNHPITGPVFSGRHQTPFVCETEAVGMGKPTDADCSAKTQVTYLYRSTLPPNPTEQPQPYGPPAGFKNFDVNAPRPNDVAEVTTTEGKKIPYIVRWERGTINRAIYEIAFLHEPGTPLPDPWTRTAGWNGRLVYNFGGGCGAGYHQGRLSVGIDNMFLSLGYAQATSTLNVLQTNCNDVLSAETAAMVKEHFIKSFGVPVHTIGWGGSGGSIQQHLIAQNYPGLLDGIIPSMSFPDVASILPGIVDCSLLAHVFDSSKLTWTDEQKSAVSGFATWGSCTNPADSWTLWFSPHLVRATQCNEAVPAELAYNATTNPTGARCDFYDNEVNIFGTNPKTGHARRALDNVGVQYGLTAFNAGLISAEQFLELNERIGGYDDDGNITSVREVADPEALRLAYATGRMNAGSGGMGSIPIIDIRLYGDKLPDIHDEYRSFVMRQRLIASNGNANNHVILTFPFVTKPSAKLGASFAAVGSTLVPKMDQWLDALAKDSTQRSLSEKIAAARPEDMVDACWTEDGEKIVQKRTYDGNTRCNQLYPPHGDPRIAAGAALQEDVLKCALKPINPKDYVHPLTSDQLARMSMIFPQGVCNYSASGVEQGPLHGTWQMY